MMSKFLIAMKKINKRTTKKERKEEEEWEKAEMEGKPPPASSLYFPELLPKLHLLFHLIQTFIDIIKAIIDILKIGCVKDAYNRLTTNVSDVFRDSIGGFFKDTRFMYLAIKNGAHYKEAVNEVGYCFRNKDDV